MYLTIPSPPIYKNTKISLKYFINVSILSALGAFYIFYNNYKKSIGKNLSYKEVEYA